MASHFGPSAPRQAPLALTANSSMPWAAAPGRLSPLRAPRACGRRGRQAGALAPWAAVLRRGCVLIGWHGCGGPVCTQTPSRIPFDRSMTPATSITPRLPKLRGQPCPSLPTGLWGALCTDPWIEFGTKAPRLASHKHASSFEPRLLIRS
ncbi:MAG: hypothetical protein J3K34DRAFT_424492 [Monoraphidium minutum]|nr:MAG: hypothetical protein J3K34DRAFT_424492 [Monoraphidium minutum]